MAKEAYDPEKVARGLFRSQVPKKISMVAFLEVTGVLMNWVRGANRRAKRAEETLNGQPIWKRQYEDQKRRAERLARDCNAAEAKVEALKTQHRAELQVMQERFSAYEDELARWRDESEKQYDECNRQLNEKDDQVKLLVEQLSAALELINCTDAVMRASVEVSNAKAKARYAELKLVSLGVKCNLEDAPEADEQGSPT